MTWRKNLACAGLIGLLLTFCCSFLVNADDGGKINKRGTIDDDLYTAGGVVDIDARVVGDVIVAGGELTIGHRVEGDVIAAGGVLRIRGEVLDDVRISGGDINIDASIGDDLAASGGLITISRGTTVGGNAWLAAGEIDMAGTIRKDLKIFGGNIRLSGTVVGNVELQGGDIQILESAIIEGNLIYHSPALAETDANANIGGQVTHETDDLGYADRGYGLFFSITLVMASILMFLLFPHYTLASVKRLHSDPWTSLGIGFLFLVFTPCFALMAMLIILGFWVGLSLLALYAVALLTGFLIACFFLGERGARLFKQDISSTGRRLISVTIAVFTLGLIQTIPFLGGLLLFLLLLIGLGAGLVQLRYVYRPVSEVS